MSYLDPLPDQEPNPYAPPRAWPEPQANSLLRNNPRHAGMIRFIAAAHLGIALFFIYLVYVVHYFASVYHVPPERWRSLVGDSCLILVAVTNLAIGMGTWMFRRWSMHLAMAQGFVMLALGFAVAIYVRYHDRDLTGISAIFPGVFFVLFAAYFRHLYTSIYESNSQAEPEDAK